MKRHATMMIGILLLTSLACTFGGLLSPTGNSSPPGGAPSNSNVLFKDDFSSTTSGWDTSQRSDGITDYYNGGYRIQVNKAQYDFWANPGLSTLPDDVRIEVDATKIGGPNENDFGLICRYQDSNNFYEFLATSDGYVGIAVVKADNANIISSSDSKLQPNDSVKSSGNTKHLEADCVGSKLTLSVNGQLVATATDSSFSSGDVGLVAGTFDTPGTDILFDNFLVSKP